MILDATTHSSNEKWSTTKALAKLINPLPFGQSISIEWFVDENGKRLSPIYLQKFISSATKNRYLFQSRFIRGNLIITRIAEGDILAKRKSGVTPSWPFYSMKVGQTIIMKQGQYGKSNPQTYAHTVAAQSNMRFTTSKQCDDYYITRTT
jgi:hypothetical protein